MVADKIYSVFCETVATQNDRFLVSGIASVLFPQAQREKIMQSKKAKEMGEEQENADFGAVVDNVASSITEGFDYANGNFEVLDDGIEGLTPPPEE